MSAGIVLFPEDTLPLRVLQPRFKAAVERAIKSEDAPNTLGVIHVRARPEDGQVTVASVGTTAEVRNTITAQAAFFTPRDRVPLPMSKLCF